MHPEWVNGAVITAADGTQYTRLDRALSITHDCIHRRNGLPCEHA